MTNTAKAIGGARTGVGARVKLTAMKKKKRSSRKTKFSTNAMLTRLRTRMVLTPAGATTTARVIGGAPRTAGAKANPTAFEQRIKLIPRL